MANLTIAQLKSEKDRLRDKIDKLDKNNNDALTDRTITLSEHSLIFSQILMLRNALAELNINLFKAIVDSITVPDGSPGAKIKTSINELETAANNLNNVRNVLNTVATVINVVNDIIGVLATVAAG